MSLHAVFSVIWSFGLLTNIHLLSLTLFSMISSAPGVQKNNRGLSTNV